MDLRAARAWPFTHSLTYAPAHLLLLPKYLLTYLLTYLLLTYRWISEQLEQLEREKRREAAVLAERARQQEIAAKAAAEIAAEIAATRGVGVGGVAPPALPLEGGNQLALAGGTLLAVGGAGAGGGARAADLTTKLAPSPPCRSPLAPLNRSGGFGAAVKEKPEGRATATAARVGTPPSTPARQATQREEVTPAKYSQRVDRARAANKQRSAQRISLSSTRSPPESPAIHPLDLAAAPGLTSPARCLVSPRC